MHELILSQITGNVLNSEINCMNSKVTSINRAYIKILQRNSLWHRNKQGVKLTT